VFGTESAAVVLDKVKGSLWGVYIGDALAMPTHWYYDQNHLIPEAHVQKNHREGRRNSHARLSISGATEGEAQFFKTLRLSISSVSRLSDGENNIHHRRRLSSVCDDFPLAIVQSAISAVTCTCLKIDDIRNLLRLSFLFTGITDLDAKSESF
jgi:hypothetical protein